MGLDACLQGSLRHHVAFCAVSQNTYYRCHNCRKLYHCDLTLTACNISFIILIKTWLSLLFESGWWFPFTVISYFRSYTVRTRRISILHVNNTKRRIMTSPYSYRECVTSPYICWEIPHVNVLACSVRTCSSFSGTVIRAVGVKACKRCPNMTVYFLSPRSC